MLPSKFSRRLTADDLKALREAAARRVPIRFGDSVRDRCQDGARVIPQGHGPDAFERPE